jgi:multiple sugar transport system substrate-binding protein
MGEKRDTFRVLVRKFGPFESAIAEQWRQFAISEGSTLELDAEPFDLHPLHSAIFEAEGPSSWDVAYLSSDWFAQAYESGVIADVGSFLQSDPPANYPDGWTPSLLQMHQFDDVVLGLPYHDGPECLIYRTDLFENPNEQARYLAQTGQPLRVPETWDEFQQVARFFQRPEEDLYGTVFAAYPDGHNTVYDFCLQLWTRGGELFDEQGKWSLQTAEAEAALTYYRTILNDQSAVHPDSREFDSVKSGMAFAGGEVAMMINWFGFAGMAETIAESNVKGKVAIANIPHGAGGQPVSLNAYWILAINADSPNVELAYRFLRHCASPEMDKLLTLEGGIGCRKSTWTDAEVNAEIPFYHRMVSLHEHARELPRLANWADIAAVIDELVLQTINTQIPIATLLEQAQHKLLLLLQR